MRKGLGFFGIHRSGRRTFLHRGGTPGTVAAGFFEDLVIGFHGMAQETYDATLTFTTDYLAPGAAGTPGESFSFAMTAIPEPSTGLACLLSAALLVLRRRRGARERGSRERKHGGRTARGSATADGRGEEGRRGTGRQSTLTRRYTGRAMKTPGHEDRPGSEQRAPLVLNHAVPLVMGQEP